MTLVISTSIFFCQRYLPLTLLLHHVESPHVAIFFWRIGVVVFVVVEGFTVPWVSPADVDGRIPEAGSC